MSLLMTAALFAPVSSFAAGQHDVLKSETVTIQVDVTLPSGTSVVGTVVVQRTPGAATTHVSYNGTIKGKPANATAEVTETWSGNTDKIHVVAITSWNAVVRQPTISDFELTWIGNGLITVNGIPFAINAPLEGPGTGNHTYVVTMPGSGSQDVKTLPQTGSGSLLSDPMMLSGLLVAVGAGLLLLGITLSRRAGRRVPATRRTR